MGGEGKQFALIFRGGRKEKKKRRRRKMREIFLAKMPGVALLHDPSHLWK